MNAQEIIVKNGEAKVTIGTEATESGYRVFSQLDILSGKMAGKTLKTYGKNYKTLRGAETNAKQWISLQKRS